MLTQDGLVDLSRPAASLNDSDNNRILVGLAGKRVSPWEGLRVPAFALLGICAFGLAYCGYAGGRYIPAAMATVHQFHQRFSAGDDDSIIFDSRGAWKGALDPETTRGLFRRIRLKMGPCSYDGPFGFEAKTNLDGTRIVLKYLARCSNGLMRESFTLQMVNGKALLVGYNPVSEKLITG